jgi:hypothetical protein
MMERKGTALAAALAAGLALAACGGSGGGGQPAGTQSAGGSASTSASSSGASSSATAAAAFSCAIKPGAGLLPSQTAKPGRVVASTDEIESAIGLPMSQSVDISMVSGLTECRYQLGNGQVNIAILDDPGQARTELAKTRSQNLALVDRACNGCSISGLTAQADLGADGYTATDDQNPVYGAISGGVYFEVQGVGLKSVRIERLALVVAANLGGGASPSLPPLPTPTPSS